MNATWRTPLTLCRELDWTRPRLIHELCNGLCYRTWPPGHVVEWHRPRVQRKFNLEAGEAEAFVQGRRLIVGIEVLPPGAPTDAEVPAPAATAPTASPALRRPSDAAVEQCFRGIMDERPDDPPDEDWLLAEMKTRLGAPPGRQRVRNLWKGIAPQWKRPRGHPRNFNSAKKSAE